MNDKNFYLKEKINSKLGKGQEDMRCSFVGGEEKLGVSWASLGAVSVYEAREFALRLLKLCEMVESESSSEKGE